MPDYFLAQSTTDFQEAKKLIRAYAAWLNIDLCFQNFDSELENLGEIYSAKNRGAMILVQENDAFIGCVGFRERSPEVAELKRMYVLPEHHKKGVGQGLLHEAMRLASEYDYKKIKLDTLRKMTPAMELYLKNGFVETTAYYHNPNADTVYFELDLEGR